MIMSHLKNPVLAKLAVLHIPLFGGSHAAPTCLSHTYVCTHLWDTACFLEGNKQPQ